MALLQYMLALTYLTAGLFVYAATVDGVEPRPMGERIVFLFVALGLMGLALLTLLDTVPRS